METKFFSFLSYIFLSMYNMSPDISKSKNSEHGGFEPPAIAKEKS